MLHLMKLEDRIVLDGAAVGEAIDHALDHDAVHADAQTDASFVPDDGHDANPFADAAASAAALLADPDPAAEPVDVVLISDNLPDYEQLVGAVDPDAEVIVYDPDTESAEDVIERLNAVSEQLDRPISSISILSHGDEGSFELGADTIDANTLQDHSDAFEKIGSVLSRDSRIYIFGCNLSGDSDGSGEELINALSQLTGAGIYASNDVTGAGGDWDLEISSPNNFHSVQTPLNMDILSQYSASLARPSLSDNPDTVVTNEIDDANPQPLILTKSDFTNSTSADPDGSFFDPDGDTLQTIKIVSAPSRGELYYNGNLVQGETNIPISEILDEGSSILRFESPPDASNDDASGQPYSNIFFLVGDSNGEFSNPNNPYRLDISVQPVNDAPTSEPGLIDTVVEDEPYTIQLNDFPFNSVDAGETQLSEVKITALPNAGEGILSYSDGTLVNIGDMVTRQQIISGALIYQSPANAFGNNVGTFSFQVGDGSNDPNANGGYSAVQQMTINVIPTEDNPTLSGSPTITLNEDLEGQDSPYQFTPGDFNVGFDDKDGDGFGGIMIKELPTAGNLFYQGVEITSRTQNVGGVNFEDLVIPETDLSNGILTFTPEADQNDQGSNPYSIITFKVVDDNTAPPTSGEAGISTAEYDLSIHVNPKEDAPTADDSNVTTPRNTSVTFTESNFNFFDVDDETPNDANDHFAQIVITALPESTAGVLKTQSGTAVNVNDSINLENQTLVFDPVSNFTGDAVFDFKVEDIDGLKSANHTMTVTVIDDNSRPVSRDFQVAMPEDGVDADGNGDGFYHFVGKDENGTTIRNDFTSNYNDPDEDDIGGIRIVKLPTRGSLWLGTQEITEANFVINADQLENLKYKPNADANGEDINPATLEYADFYYQARDSQDTYSQTSSQVQILVTPVQDKPTSDTSQVTLYENDDDYSFKASDFIFNDPDNGDSLHSIQITNLNLSAGAALTLPNGTVLQSGDNLNGPITVAVARLNDLVYTPGTNRTADASFQFKVDDGQPNPGGISDSDYKMNIDVLEEPPPVAEPDKIFFTELDKGESITIGDYLINISPDPNPEMKDLIQDLFNFRSDVVTLETDNIIITKPISGGTLSLDNVVLGRNAEVPISRIGDLVFTANANIHGDQDGNQLYSELEFRVKEAAAENPNDQSNVLNLKFYLFSENDPPSGEDFTRDVEGGTYIFTIDDFQDVFSDLTDAGDGHEFYSIRIESLPGVGELRLYRSNDPGDFVVISQNDVNSDLPVTEISESDLQNGFFRYFTTNNALGVDQVNFNYSMVDDAGPTSPADLFPTAGLSPSEIAALNGIGGSWTQHAVSQNPNRVTLNILAPPQLAPNLEYIEDVSGQKYLDSNAIIPGGNGIVDSAVLSILSNYQYEPEDMEGNPPDLDALGFKDSDFNFDGGTITEQAEGTWRIDFDSGNTINVSWNATQGTLSLDGAATADEYQSMMRLVTFEHRGDDPTEDTRIVQLSVMQNGVTQSDSISVLVDAINDAPQLSPIQETIQVGSGGEVAIAPNIELTDVDDDKMSGAVITITEGFDANEDVLSFVAPAGTGIIGNFAGNTLTLNGVASVEAYEQVLRSITYENTAGATSGTRTISITVTDNNSSFGGDNTIGSRRTDFVEPAPPGVGGPLSATATRTLDLNVAPPHRPPFQPPPFERPPFEPIVRPEGEGPDGPGLGPVTFPGDVQDTGQLQDIARALSAPCGDDVLYQCCTLEEALKIGCRFAPAIDPDARLCNITWDYMTNSLGWEDPFAPMIDGRYFNEELDLFNRLFMKDVESDPGFQLEPGAFADAFGMAEEAEWAKFNRDEEHDVYSQFSMQEAQGFNDMAPGELKEAFFKGREGMDKPARWSKDGDDSNC